MVQPVLWLERLELRVGRIWLASDKRIELM